MKRVTVGLVLFGISMVLVAAATGCEGEYSSRGEGVVSSITNGSPTGYTEWKGVVALLGDGTLCTGTFIDPQVVLTAAHCVYLPSHGVNYVSSPSVVQVVGGADVYSSYTEYASGAAEIVIHPTWTGDEDDFATGQIVDMALVRLAQAPSTSPECFPVRASQPGTAEEGWLVGYGQTGSYNTGSLGVQREGESRILSVFNANYFETGDPAGFCDGDSGGPFFTGEGDGWAVTGVISTGDGVCDPTSGNFSTNAVTHREWIADTVFDWTGRDIDDPSSDADADTDSDGDSDSDTDSDGDSDPDASVEDDDEDHVVREGGQCSFCSPASDRQGGSGILRLLTSLL